MKILMVGTGYVGLVSAACFAEMGHSVVCLDIDVQKIAGLNKGIIPIYEPGLAELVVRNANAGRLTFTTDYAQALTETSVCFLAVSTPSNPDGSCNLSYIFAAASQIAQHMNGPMTLVIKSTVPVGTAFQVKKQISASLKERGCEIDFDIVSNPEFLKEGNAIADCMRPDRIILGLENPDAEQTMRAIYSPFALSSSKILIMDLVSSEMTKYAANSMLALRITFMNELARLCEIAGADIKNVRSGIGSDPRIGIHFLNAGAGYGGSCFPKDVRALCSTARENDTQLSILEAVEAANERQKRLLALKILSYFFQQGGIRDKTIAVWGLSFKPDTDDIREAPSALLIQELLSHGAQLRVYDPVAIPNMRKVLDHPRLTFCNDEYDAARGADAIALVTEWIQFRSVDLSKITPHLKQKVFFDGRNQFHLSEMQALGFEYFGMGVPSSRQDVSTLAFTLQKQLIQRLDAVPA